MPPLTLAELIDEVRRLGGDPSTTTLAFMGQIVTIADGDYSISRESGATIVDIGWDYDGDDEIDFDSPQFRGGVA